MDTGTLGGYEIQGCGEYNSNRWYRFVYHVFLDWDGTIIRIAMLGDEFDFYDFRFRSTSGNGS